MDTGRLLTAMVTPFTDDNRIDEAGIDTIVNHLIETGTTALVVCGTTGESPTLTHDEKRRVIDRTLRAAAGRVPVIAGTGSNDTAASVSFTREIAQTGVQGILLVTPYYNRPTQEGLYAHFATIAESMDLPIMLYNVPTRTACRIEVPTILELAAVPNIVSIKEASGDLAHITRLVAEKPDDFAIFSGDDKLTLPILAVGGVGLVSVASHLVGRQVSLMMDAFFAGRVGEAAQWNARLLTLFEALFHPSSASPAAVKAMLTQKDLPSGLPRLPVLPAPQLVIDILSEELRKLGKYQVGPVAASR